MGQNEELNEYLNEVSVGYFDPADTYWLPRRGEYEPPPEELWPNMADTLYIAEVIFERYGGGININSGYRPLDYNREVGSSDTSEHVVYKALDLMPDGDIKEFKRVVREVVGELREQGINIGLGEYDSFVHIDVNAKNKRRNRSW